MDKEIVLLHRLRVPSREGEAGVLALMDILPS